jgi:phosphatidylinositol kinase/protein kinase (PI-3  family)
MASLLLLTHLQPFLVDGVLVPAMVSMAQALSDKVEVLKPYLALMLRDDLISWHASKIGPRGELEQRAIEKQLTERMNKNVSKVRGLSQITGAHVCRMCTSCASPSTLQVLERFSSVRPLNGARDEAGKAIPVDSKVYDLVDAASCEGNLMRMNPVWMPWL